MKKNVMLTALVLLALSQPLSALTRDRPVQRAGSFEIQPSVGLALGFDNGRDFAIGFGLRGFYNLSEFTAIGLRYGRTDFTGNLNTDFVQQSIQAEFRLLAQSGWFQSYLMAFAGLLSTKIKSSFRSFPSQSLESNEISHSLFTLGAGFGFMQRVSSSTEIFFEGVFSATPRDAISYHTAELRAGYSFSF